MNRKRQRVEVHTGGGSGNDSQHPQSAGVAPVGDDAFIADQDAVESGGDDDDDEDKPKGDKKAGRRKIKIEFIQDKSRRHITFSKRKAGIMKKAYELSTLTGTQVLLLVVSETGLVYTFTTAKLQPLVTQPEGKNLIQACLNAPHGSMPSSMPVGTPMGHSSRPMNMSSSPQSANMPGGLSIGQNSSTPLKDEGDDGEEDDSGGHGGRAMAGDKRRRTSSSNIGSGPGPTSPHTSNAPIPPPLSIPAGASGPPSAQPHPSSTSASSPQLPLGASPTSPQQQHSSIPQTPSQSQYPSSYGHGHPSQSQHQHHQPQQGDGPMYSPHMMPPGSYSYAGSGGAQPLGGLAQAAATHGHWGAPQQQAQAVQQGQHYGRR